MMRERVRWLARDRPWSHVVRAISGFRRDAAFEEARLRGIAFDPLGIKIVVISNSSLIDQKDVRADLAGVDWVSPGWIRFARICGAGLTGHTVLCNSAVFSMACEPTPLTTPGSFPLRPCCAVEWVRLPSEEALNQAYQFLSGCVERVEVLSGYEGNEFAYTGDAAQDILSITAVHPMRDDAVSHLLERSRAEWSAVQDLIEAEQLVESVYEGLRSYLRRLFRRA